MILYNRIAIVFAVLLYASCALADQLPRQSIWKTGQMIEDRGELQKQIITRNASGLGLTQIIDLSSCGISNPAQTLGRTCCINNRQSENAPLICNSSVSITCPVGTTPDYEKLCNDACDDRPPPPPPPTSPSPSRSPSPSPSPSIARRPGRLVIHVRDSDKGRQNIEWDAYITKTCRDLKGVKSSTANNGSAKCTIDNCSIVPMTNGRIQIPAIQRVGRSSFTRWDDCDQKSGTVCNEGCSNIGGESSVTAYFDPINRPPPPPGNGSNGGSGGGSNSGNPNPTRNGSGGGSGGGASPRGSLTYSLTPNVTPVRPTN